MTHAKHLARPHPFAASEPTSIADLLRPIAVVATATETSDATQPLEGAAPG